MDKSIESFESFESLLCRVYELCWSCSQKLRLGSTTHLEISEAHLRSVSHFLGLRKILPPPSTNAAIPQVRVEEKIKSLGFCSDISHFLPLILTRKKAPLLGYLFSMVWPGNNLNWVLSFWEPACCVESMSFSQEGWGKTQISWILLRHISFFAPDPDLKKRPLH